MRKDAALLFTTIIALTLGACDHAAEFQQAPCETSEAVIDCPPPWLPRLTQLHTGANWEFAPPAEGQLTVEVSHDLRTPVAARPALDDGFTVEGEGPVHVTVTLNGVDGCDPVATHWTYEGVTAYAPRPGEPGSTAVDKDDARLTHWASEIVSFHPGSGLARHSQDTSQSLGPASGDPARVVMLGDGGEVTVGFDVAIHDGPGPDFAIFENGFNDGYLELAFVQVSTDGVHFLAFPSAYLGHAVIGPFDEHDPELVDGLAGKYRLGFGTPFDLHVLEGHPMVSDGRINLSQIRYVRILDIVGDGNTTDSFGNAIYDPHPVAATAGFDLDGVGVLHASNAPPCAP